MNIKRIAAAIGAAGIVLAGVGMTTAASAAPAVHHSYSMPRIQTGHPLNGWSRKAGTWKIAPASVYFGGGASFAAPRIKNIHYVYYGHNNASAYVRAWWDNCVPSCVAGGHWVNASAYFYHPVNHSGPGWNFSRVVVTYKHGGTYFKGYIDRHGWWV